jgi:hypothetical protein
MSHITTIRTEVRDVAAVKAACARLKLPSPVHGTVRLFDGSQPTGWLVNLPDWHYPVVCDTDTGIASHDNYGGAWGKQEHLDRFLQMYAVEKAKIEVRKKGYAVREQSLPDGSIKLTVQVGS